MGFYYILEGLSFNNVLMNKRNLMYFVCNKMESKMILSYETKTQVAYPSKRFIFHWLFAFFSFLLFRHFLLSSVNSSF